TRFSRDWSSDVCSSDLRQAILNAARDCFAQKGYDQVTVRDIISKTNLASGTFYNYFTDKESIFRAILDDYLKRLNQQLFTLQQRSEERRVGKSIKQLSR